MAKDESKFTEFVDSLQKSKFCFLKGIVRTNDYDDKTFINQVEILERYISIINDKIIKKKVTDFVEEVTGHDYYRIYKKEQKKRDFYKKCENVIFKTEKNLFC